MSAPQTLFEVFTIYLFEYLMRVNKVRLQQTGYSLTEKYQVAELVRTLKLLQPLARFHGLVTSSGVIVFLLFGRNVQNGPTDPILPIFEESINFLQLRGILLPIIFIRHERKERARKVDQLEKNNSSNGFFAPRHTSEIMKGW
ncbi:hypothetical protein PENTCL1PPCAC_15805 [Pristionchus entomophagus]|uniref:G protein-coupled receptor n=1 Tax=Pristionchus entomophagus TaxID=358040 RepID=A0AAV5TH40_9BILA|nr:hypothetical protein PENTCL1PPCAC_15805 [Pristionchus entomophagus]